MSRANLWRCRREASTSRFIDHESNHLQVCRRKQAARVRDEMKTKGREKEGEATLLSIFLKAFALRYKTHDPTTTVEILNEILRVMHVKWPYACVNILSRSYRFGFVALSVWYLYWNTLTANVYRPTEILFFFSL